MNFPAGHVGAHRPTKPLGIAIVLVTPDVVLAHARAGSAGAREISASVQKLRGQTVP